MAVLGLAAHWRPVLAVGAGLCLLVLGSGVHVLRRPRLTLVRAVEPPRVQKGSPAVSVVKVTNLSRRSLSPTTIVQRLGGRPVAAELPRLRPGERALRTYRLPTTRRGTFDVSAVELPRADPFGFCRTALRFGEPQRISVHPRILDLRPLPVGASRNLEGPSSDSSPQGSLTFHRLREYVVGDDLRAIHWPSTARHGRLVVRHHVDTAQPYTVVLLDLDPGVYSAETFEEAVDVAASVSVSLAGGRAPVQLRTTAGDRVGGPAYRDPTAIVDFLTDVGPSGDGTLEEQLVLLRRDRGGTALVVVTGRMERADLPQVAALRRRFDRVVVLSVVERPGGVPAHPGISVVTAGTASETAERWNASVAR